METLTCESCGQDWERERKRGRKPKECPACKSDLRCFCGRDFSSEHGKKIHQSRKHTDKEVKQETIVDKSTYCKHGLCITCNKMGKPCDHWCHTDEQYAKYRP